MEQKSTFWKSAMTYGLYLALAVILYSVVLYVIGENLNKTLGALTYIIVAIGILLCQLDYRNKILGGSISYSKALGLGVIVMIFAGLLNSVYTVVIIKIDPTILDQIQIMQEEAMMRKGISDDQIEMASDMMKAFQKPGFIAVMGMLSFAFMGFIISLITSIFVKKNNPDAFEEAMEEVKTED